MPGEYTRVVGGKITSFKHSTIPFFHILAYLLAPSCATRMPSVTFSQTPGPLGELFTSFGVSHAAKIPLSGSLVVTSGQPGFDLQTGELVTTSLRDEIEACFNCVDAALKASDVKLGLAGVHKFTCFLTDVRHDALMMEIWNARMPDHHPTWATVGISALAIPGMHIELQAEAIILE